MKLHHEVVSAPEARPRQALLLLHGILGSGANLRTLARRFVQLRPEWAGVLLDLRAHGESLERDGEDTVENTARDVAQTARALPLTVRGAFGHSFGGKVALALPEHLPELEHVMLVDSSPGLRSDALGSELTLAVVELLERLHGPYPTRGAFVSEVERGGYDKSLGQWLAMSLRQDADGFRFSLELPRIHALLDSYFSLDLWGVVERAARGRLGPKLHLVIGDRSQVYQRADRERAAALVRESLGQVTVDVLPAGHWVHVDDFEGLVQVMNARL